MRSFDGEQILNESSSMDDFCNFRITQNSPRLLKESKEIFEEWRLLGYYDLWLL
jgi:hypothetical protein